MWMGHLYQETEEKWAERLEEWADGKESCEILGSGHDRAVTQQFTGCGYRHNITPYQTPPRTGKRSPGPAFGVSVICSG